MPNNPNIDFSQLSDADRAAFDQLHNEIEQADKVDVVREAETTDAEVLEAVVNDHESDEGEIEPSEVSKAIVLDAKPALKQNKNGKPERSIDNFAAILETDPKLKGRFYYDVRSYRKMVEPPLPWGMPFKKERPVKDTDYSGFTQYAEHNYNLYGKQYATDAIANICDENPRNKLAEWLDSLEWDGTKRIDTLLADFLGAEQSDANAEFMRVFLLQAVARAYVPGTQADYALILIGSQGIGKTAFTRLLAHCDEWYLPDLPDLRNENNATETLQGKWIVEIQEMKATSNAGIKTVKSFITRPFDTYRKKYGRESEDMKRSIVFVATTNDVFCLIDKTGNRRWLPVSCWVNTPKYNISKKANRDVNVVEKYQPYFDQVWAEAVHIWKAEKPLLSLSGEADRQAELAQAMALEDDPRKPIIEQYLNTKVENEKQKANPKMSDVRICVADLIENALLEYQVRGNNKQLEKEMHAIMRTMPGWVLYPFAGGKARCGKYGSPLCYIPEEGAKELVAERQAKA